MGTKQIAVYGIINKNNGKVYVGSSIDIKERWSRHRYILKANKGENIYLQRAWNKHGKQAFAFVILQLTTEDQLRDMETKWIKRLGSAERRNGYNLDPTPNTPMLGRKHTPEARAKMSLAQMGKKKGITLTAEHRRKIGESVRATGYRHPQEIRDRIGAAHQGKKLTEEHLQHLREINTGKKVSDETKRKIREQLTGRKMSEEQRAKLRGRKLSEQHLAKLRGRKFSDDHRRHLSEAMKGNTNGRRRKT
jgi:group I intron endonuclease